MPPERPENNEDLTRTTAEDLNLAKIRNHKSSYYLVLVVLMTRFRTS